MEKTQPRLERERERERQRHRERERQTDRQTDKYKLGTERKTKKTERIEQIKINRQTKDHWQNFNFKCYIYYKERFQFPRSAPLGSRLRNLGLCLFWKTGTANSIN